MRNNNIELKTCLLLTLVMSGVLQACQNHPSPLVEGAGAAARQGDAITELTNEEIVDLESRQANLIDLRKAFLDATEPQRRRLALPDADVEGDLEAALESRSDDDTRSWLALRKTLVDSTIGYAWEGRQGELLLCEGKKYGRIRIIRSNDRLELLEPDTDGIFRFVGIVRRTGEYLPLKRFRGEVGGLNLSNAPNHWGIIEKGDIIDFRIKESQILCAVKSKSERPIGALGWLFPTRDGVFVCAPAELEPVQNIVWVIQNGRGIDLVHSGEEFKGYYAQVSPEGRIVFRTRFNDFPKVNNPEAKWQISDFDGRPVFNATALAGSVLSSDLEYGEVLRISESGELSIRETHRDH